MKPQLRPRRVLPRLAAAALAVAAAIAPVALPAAADNETEEVVYVVKSYVHGVQPLFSDVVMLRSGSLAELGSIRLLRGAHTVAVTPDRQRIWVTQPPPNRITVIDAERFEVLENIDLGDILLYSPEGVAITPDGNEAWVTYFGTGEIGVYDASTGAYVDDFAVGGVPDFVCFTPDGAKAYVVDYQNATVTSIRASDREILATRDFFGHRCQDAVVSPDGTRFYMANEDADQVEVIRTSDDAVLAPIPTGDRPRGIAISPGGEYLYVGHWLPSGAVHMIALPDGSLLDSVAGFGNARRLALNPAGTRLFVSDHDLDAAAAIAIEGETLRIDVVADLNVDPELHASPVGIAVGRYPRPVPDVKLNGSDGPIRLTWADRGRLGLALDANGRDDEADLWVAARTPVGLLFLTPSGWSASRVPLYQGRLRDVPFFEYPEVPLSGWAPGNYVFGFAVDVRRDGLLTIPLAYADKARLTITP